MDECFDGFARGFRNRLCLLPQDENVPRSCFSVTTAQRASRALKPHIFWVDEVRFGLRHQLLMANAKGKNSCLLKLGVARAKFILQCVNGSAIETTNKKLGTGDNRKKEKIRGNLRLAHF
jgi:hypothetical protein